MLHPAHASSDRVMDRGDGRVDAPPDWAERSQGIWPGHSAPLPLALTAQDSVPRRTATHRGGHYAGGYAYFLGLRVGRVPMVRSCVPSCRWRTSTPPSQEVVPLAADPSRLLVLAAWWEEGPWTHSNFSRRPNFTHHALILHTLQQFPSRVPPHIQGHTRYCGSDSLCRVVTQRYSCTNCRAHRRSRPSGLAPPSHNAQALLSIVAVGRCEDFFTGAMLPPVDRCGRACGRSQHAESERLMHPLLHPPPSVGSLLRRNRGLQHSCGAQKKHLKKHLSQQSSFANVRKSYIH